MFRVVAVTIILSAAGVLIAQDEPKTKATELQRLDFSLPAPNHERMRARAEVLREKMKMLRQRPPAYPISLDANDLHQFATLSIQRNALQLTAKDVVVMPIRCEAGITGAMLFGNGKFAFTPPDAPEIKGTFRAVMLRFSPADQPQILPLNTATVIEDYAAYEMCRHLLNDVFRHCHHGGAILKPDGTFDSKACIPVEGTLAANLYSRTYGDLLISTSSKLSVVHNYSDNQTLYSSRSKE